MPKTRFDIRLINGVTFPFEIENDAQPKQEPLNVVYLGHSTPKQCAACGKVEVKAAFSSFNFTQCDCCKEGPDYCLACAPAYVTNCQFCDHVICNARLTKHQANPAQCRTSIIVHKDK